MSGIKDNEFKGIGLSEESKAWSNLTMLHFQPKTFAPDDVEIAITHCGICGSDIHTLTGGWGGVTPPLIVGHEIVGTAVRVGENVTTIKVGDRVGVGAGVQSCHECDMCLAGDENYCSNILWTYGNYYPDGVKTMGGYATGIRANQQFVFPIPDAVPSEDAASMLCAGLTVFSPLLRFSAGPGKKVGIIGIGGLGHYGLMFAKALGAEVTAFSHSPSKEADARKMGADHFVVSSEKGFEKRWNRYFDVIICTLDVSAGFPLAPYLSTLHPKGSFVMVGLPDEPLPSIKAFSLTSSAVTLTGSAIGNKKEALEMLDLAAKHHIKPWIQTMPMSKAPEAVELMKAGQARYRIILEQDLDNRPVHPSHL